MPGLEVFGGDRPRILAIDRDSKQWIRDLNASPGLRQRDHRAREWGGQRQLVHGRMIAHGSPTEVRNDPVVIRVYLGA